MNRATAETQKEIAEEEGLAPILAWVKDLIDQIIAQEFDAPDLEFAWSAEPSIDPQAQEAILSSYTSKGIITINEARAALGRDPYPDAAANKPMTLTGGGYVGLGEGAQAPLIAKDNPYHDERGRFTTADGAANSSSHPTNTQTAELEQDARHDSSSLTPADRQRQQALVSCEELWDSDWAICHSNTFAGDPYNYKQCMIGLLQRNKECLAGLPLSPLLPY
jgi:hypothetical protein